MRIGPDTAQHQLLWPELVERVRFAESAGLDGAWVFDHFKPLYGDPDGPCMEAWTLLAGLAAWHEPEHEELGIPFPPLEERAERLDEGAQVMRLLMTKDRATFAGRHYQLAEASYHPRPIQRPHPPIWIGAGGE